jgi:hypothetical protein
MSKSRKTAGTKEPMRQPAKTIRRADASTQQKRQTKQATSPVSAKASAPDTSMQRSKKAIIVALLQRPDGAPLSDLTGATGWQAHSVRAALTGLRKEGKELTRTRDAAGVTHYRLATAA